MSKVKRNSKNSGTLGSNDIASAGYNARSGGHKNLIIGPQLKIPASGTVTAALDASAGLQFPAGTCFAIYNNGALAWATMSLTLPAAPSSLATGIPLKANDWTYLSLGSNAYIRTSAATVGVYIIEDDTTLQVLSDDETF